MITLVAALLAPAAVFASAEESIIAQLASQGFESISKSRTLLGRVRIVAKGKDFEREIIFNPRTGEILRDYWETSDGNTQGLLKALKESLGKTERAERGDDRSDDRNDDRGDDRGEDRGDDRGDDRGGDDGGDDGGGDDGGHGGDDGGDGDGGGDD